MKEIAIAVLGLILGAIIGPYINWGIEKKKQKLAYRRELIAKWRAMLDEAGHQDIGRGKETDKLLTFLEKHKDFTACHPTYLQTEVYLKPTISVTRA